MSSYAQDNTAPPCASGSSGKRQNSIEPISTFSSLRAPSMNVLNLRGWMGFLILELTARAIQAHLQEAAPLVRSGLASIDDGDLTIRPRFRRLATAPGDWIIDVTLLLLDIATPADLE